MIPCSVANEQGAHQIALCSLPAFYFRDIVDVANTNTPSTFVRKNYRFPFHPRRVACLKKTADIAVSIVTQFAMRVFERQGRRFRV